MLSTYLLSLREGLEAALIVGIVLGALRQVRRTELKPVVWAGVGSASVASVVVAVLLLMLGVRLEGRAEEIFEGVTMFLAAAILTWMIFWMGRQAQTIRGRLEEDVRQALVTGRRGLFALAFLAVVREGVELALFLVAAIFAAESPASDALVGTSLGLATAVLIAWSFFTTTARLDMRRFFWVTGALLLLFAAGLVAHGVHEFNEVGWIPPLVEHVWDLNPILDENSTLGQMLKALFGYNGNPSLSEVLAYLAYFAAVLLGLYRANRTSPVLAEPRA